MPEHVGALQKSGRGLDWQWAKCCREAEVWAVVKGRSHPEEPVRSWCCAPPPHPHPWQPSAAWPWQWTQGHRGKDGAGPKLLHSPGKVLAREQAQVPILAPLPSLAPGYSPVGTLGDVFKWRRAASHCCHKAVQHKPFVQPAVPRGGAPCQESGMG